MEFIVSTTIVLRRSFQGEVVSCVIDDNGKPTSLNGYSQTLITGPVQLAQMVQLLMLVLVVWTTLVATAAVLICVGTILSKTIQSSPVKVD